MANQTVKDAIYIKGTNPQYLVEKIIRTRIYDCRYWKEECFALTAELLVDKAMELKSIGGVYGGNVKPSSFLCLILKMLQIQPEKEIIIEFIRNEDFKYVRALGAFYMRLTGASVDVYKYLEPLYIDYRKMKRMNKNAKYELIHMDEFIDELLNGDRVCDVAMPRIQKRHVLEELNEIEPRISPLDVNLDDVESSSSSDESEEAQDDESTHSEVESGEEKETKHREKKKRHEHTDDEEKSSKSRIKTGRDQASSSGNKSSRFKYTDYDNPNEEDEIKRYKRSPSPKHSRSKRRSRSRSREDYRASSKRDNERERDRDRDRDRDRERSDREKRSRTRSRDRRDRKRSDNERSHKSDAGKESDRDRKSKDKPKSRNRSRS